MRVAAGFVIFRLVQGEVQYLLLRASYGIQHWSPPKGHVDPGEDEFTTALRETEEEAGYSAQDLIIYKEHQQIINYAVKGKPKRVVYWLAKLDPYKEPKLSEEHIELAWDTYPEAIKRANFTEFNQMLSKFDEIIRKNYVCRE